MFRFRTYQSRVMAALDQSQIDFFNEHGYLVIEDAVDAKTLSSLTQDFANWVDESRSQTNAYGEAFDGRPRFDIEAGHTKSNPALRRVNAPIEISDAYYKAMAESHMADCVAELIGPDIKFHHSKINSKLPGAKTEVKWHQDFPFTPHSNDDLITALLMVDEVTDENGPLEVVPGSHKGDIHSLWHGGVFTGAIAEDAAENCRSSAVTCKGSAGSVCLMHTRLLHGSAPNLSNSPRTLFIAVYSAEDAIPQSPNPMPNKYEGLLVRGEKTNRVRSVPYDIELPQIPKGASFFEQQAEG